MPENALVSRTKALIAKCQEEGNWAAKGTELLQGTLTIMTEAYGHGSPHVRSFQEVHTRAFEDGPAGDIGFRARQAVPVIRGALENVLGELDAGLIGNLRKEITGEIITDFIQLARKTLEGQTEGAKNVAAVLAAAAYEDTIRRMGRDFAGVLGQDDLSDVINALKSQGVLKSPQLGVALSYMSFRNHALHANWEQIDRSSVTSVLGFVEELLLKLSARALTPASASAPLSG